MLGGGAMVTVALAGPRAASAVLPDSSAPSGAAVTGAMPTRNLGKTGCRVGIFSLGGQAALEWGNNEANAVPIIERALDLGVNYLDTSSIYGGPERWSRGILGR